MKKDEIQADASFLEAVENPLVEIHKSNVLKLEIEELLDECRLNFQDVSWSKAASDYITFLSNIVTNIPETEISKEGCPFILRSGKVSLIQMPLGLKLLNAGAYGFNGLTKKSGNANVIPCLDCAIVIPDSYWHTKDYSNHRYLDKRNLVLWKIASYLSGKNHRQHVGKVQWRYYNGNKYTPSLILTPPVTRVSTKERNSKKDPPSKFTVQILMAMESLDWIPPARMFPNRSNIKGHLPSPYYNYMLARDAFSILLPQMILQDMTEFPHFKDTFILSKIWCLQHGFLRGHDTFDETQIAVILSYLFRTKRIASRMAPLQAFTVYIRFLAEEWISKELVLPENEKNEAQTISACQNNKAYAAQVNQSPLNPQCDPATLLQCHRTFSSSPAILLNSSMSGNLLGGLSPSFCSSVTYQAKHTLESLTSSRSLSTIFMNTFRFWTCLDSYFHISIDHICWKRAKLWGSSVHDLGEVECITRGLYWTLKKALGDRIVDIRFLTTGNHHNVHDGNSDQIPTYDMSYCATTPQSNLCPLGTNKIVVGLKINPDTCHRAVDRGPPADNSDGVKSFLELWGEAAEIRRFKDGEIVHAVVWNPPKPCLNNKFIIFDGDERTQGGIVERIIQHILTFHFLKETELPDEFMLRDMMSMVEGVRLSTLDPLQKLIASSNAAHRSIMDAFDSLAEFLRANSEIINSNEKGSALGLPLQIDAVEPLSPALRYSCTFPPIPHPSLGADVIRKGISSGVIPYDPITIQIRFGRSSKWPTDVRAIGAAKTAMLFQLIEGIEAMKRKKSIDGFEGPCVVTPFGLLIGYRGYSWRVIVRADPELYLLGNLVSPSEQAKSILKSLTRQHIRAASHHSIVHAIHTSHPSSGHVVRLFNIWMAGHMLSGLIPFEAVELMVAKVYSDKASTLAPPGTVVSGFLRLLRLLSVHDWVRAPLVVDPQGHLSDDDHKNIQRRFSNDRGIDFSKGPIMYIITPYDCKNGLSEEASTSNVMDRMSKTAEERAVSWCPTYTQDIPERVTLFRAVALAKRSYHYLLDCLMDGKSKNWTCVFKETESSLKSYGMLLRVNKEFITDTSLSSTGDEPMFGLSVDGGLQTLYMRSAVRLYDGPKDLRRKLYRNLINPQSQYVMHEWKPIKYTVELLRHRLGRFAMFLYNEFSPEIISVLWRPPTSQSKAFAALNSEYVRPVEAMDWKSDSLVEINKCDIMRELYQITQHIVVNHKVFDDTSSRVGKESKLASRKRRHSNADEVSD